jgi:hypothetical protein
MNQGVSDFVEWQEVDGCAAVTLTCNTEFGTCRIVYACEVRRLFLTSWLLQRGHCVQPSDACDFILSVFNTEICGAEDTNLRFALV